MNSEILHQMAANVAKLKDPQAKVRQIKLLTRALLEKLRERRQ